jgi:hypothetical protein
MKGCGERYESVHDYTCLFYKRERVDGRLTTQAVMSMKARTRPMSVYLRFFRPNAGREAIWVWGQNQGRVVVHDVGVYKFLAGTMHLDPLGSRAMEDNRHPITDAGIGRLIETVNGRWDHELKPGESIVTIHPDQRLGDRPSLLIVTVHPERRPEFLFHQVKIYIDREHNLPVRFEGYDWPTRPGAAPELVEEYIYANLKLNVGLTERDFDPHNEQYSFGRF